MFLHHPKVPSSVKSFISKQIIFKTEFYTHQNLSKYILNFGNDVSSLVLTKRKKFFNTTDVIRELEPFSKYSVLNFHSLYGNIIDYTQMDDFNTKISKGLESLHGSNYKVVKFLNTII